MILAGLVIAGVFGLDTRQTLSYQIFALCLSLLLFSLAGAMTFRGRFDCIRRLPDFATAGTPLTYRLYLGNRKNKSQHDLLVIDELEEEFPAFEDFRKTNDPDDKYRNFFDRFIGYPRLLSLIRNRRGGLIRPQPLDTIAAGDQQEMKMSLMPLRRGYLRFNRIRILRPDPFGLFRAQKTCRQDDSLVVLPEQYKLPPLQMRGQRKYQPGGINMSQSVGDSEEFFSLREYRPGDPIRAIHWKSYARKGEPVVKEFQDEYFVRQGLVLDTFLDDRPPQVLEDAVSIAASFVTTIPQQDALLDMLFVGDKAHRFTTGRGLDTTEHMLEVLACVEPCDKLPFSTLVRLIREHAASTSGFICVFLDWDSERQKLVEQLRAVKLPVHVVIITTGERDFPAQVSSGNFWVLQSGRIRSSLDSILSAS